MSRVYDSGDIMETFFTSDAATDSDKAIYNSYYQSSNSAQSQYVDRTSINWGPNPTAIATGNINGTQVVVVANGNVGGLYTFSIDVGGSGDPQVAFEGFIRRGSPGLTWADAYKRSDDAVGEPGIEDLL
ncbi:mesenchyme-specific cell surface glycoprotein [Elysia marginata]|uniref:Mesenchyme-specific cell surface glycoprotein n=1 Tax=Elysia marginata TaxID=1093978 RepID=A0AAV4EZN0_9GAST|nr:mesenchyme-specific cell surface glycoprotein [Elysia marginata]